MCSSDLSQPANAPTGVAPETVGSRILDLVPSVRSMPVFDELREAFEANVPLVRKDLTLPTGTRGKQFDLVAYRSASLMHVYGQDNSTRAASLDGFDVAFALESYFKGRMRDGSGTRIRAFYDAVDRGAGAAMVMRAPSGRSEPIEVDVLSPDVEISILSKSGRGDRAKG